MKDVKLWTALITPMREGGGIHFEDLEKVVRRQEEAGNGILLIGSTGEGLALSDVEKYAVVDYVSKMNPSVPLMVGVGGFNLDLQKKWIDSCNMMNIDAFLLVSPLYAKPGPVGHADWFMQLMDQSAKPCMLYNIPSRTGVKMSVGVLKAVKNHENFWSVKEASGSIDDYSEFRETCPNVPLFSGDDALLPFFSRMGCSGLVSVSSNVWPKATSRYVEKCLDGDTEAMLPLWSKAIGAMFSSPNPIPAKVLLHKKGVLQTDVLRAPLTSREVNDMDLLMDADKIINEWFKKVN